MEREARSAILQARTAIEVGGATDPMTNVLFASGSVIGAGAAQSPSISLPVTGVYDVYALAWTEPVVAATVVRVCSVAAERTTLTSRQIDTLIVGSFAEANRVMRSLTHRLFFQAGDLFKIDLPAGGLLGEVLAGRIWARRVL